MYRPSDRLADAVMKLWLQKGSPTKRNFLKGQAPGMGRDQGQAQGNIIQSPPHS